MICLLKGIVAIHSLQDIKDKDKSEDGSAKHPPKKVSITFVINLLKLEFGANPQEPDKVIRKEVTKEVIRSLHNALVDDVQFLIFADDCCKVRVLITCLQVCVPYAMQIRCVFQPQWFTRATCVLIINT